MLTDGKDNRSAPGAFAQLKAELAHPGIAFFNCYLVAVCGAERDLVVLELPAVSQQMFPKECSTLSYLEYLSRLLYWG